MIDHNEAVFTLSVVLSVYLSCTVGFRSDTLSATSFGFCTANETILCILNLMSSELLSRRVVALRVGGVAVGR